MTGRGLIVVEPRRSLPAQREGAAPSAPQRRERESWLKVIERELDAEAAHALRRALEREARIAAARGQYQRDLRRFERLVLELLALGAVLTLLGWWAL